MHTTPLHRKSLQKYQQETLVHTPKLWAEEIPKRASLLEARVNCRARSGKIMSSENNRREPRRSFV